MFPTRSALDPVPSVRPTGWGATRSRTIRTRCFRRDFTYFRFAFRAATGGFYRNRVGLRSQPDTIGRDRALCQRQNGVLGVAEAAE